MKKILFSLVALVCSMSMNAQIMKVMKGNTVVATYKASKADNVVFEEAPVLGKTGTEKRTGNIDVNWVQLWENGPRFAEYNVGATSETGYGGYYFWGKSIDKDYPNPTYKDGTDALTGADDTATNLWGDNWRMPTKEELDALLANCDVVWTDNYKESGVKGRVFTGRDAYASNSMFLPAAGSFSEFGSTSSQGSQGRYSSSTPSDDDRAPVPQAWGLSFQQNNQGVWEYMRKVAISVRAVLAE